MAVSRHPWKTAVFGVSCSIIEEFKNQDTPCKSGGRLENEGGESTTTRRGRFLRRLGTCREQSTVPISSEIHKSSYLHVVFAELEAGSLGSGTTEVWLHPRIDRVTGTYIQAQNPCLPQPPWRRIRGWGLGVGVQLGSGRRDLSAVCGMAEWMKCCGVDHMQKKSLSVWSSVWLSVG